MKGSVLLARSTECQGPLTSKMAETILGSRGHPGGFFFFLWGTRGGTEYKPVLSFLPNGGIGELWASRMVQLIVRGGIAHCFL